MKQKTSLGAKLVAAPYYLWAAIFIVVPVIMVAYYAFTDESGAFTLDNFMGLQNFGGLLIGNSFLHKKASR